MVPGEVCIKRSEKGNHSRKAVLNKQKTAEAIVAERRRVESVGVSKYNRERRSDWKWQKTGKKRAAHKRIVRNTKNMRERQGRSVGYGRKGTVYRRSSWRRY